jgi:hypothetical protein
MPPPKKKFAVEAKKHPFYAFLKRLTLDRVFLRHLCALFTEPTIPWHASSASTLHVLPAFMHLFFHFFTRTSLYTRFCLSGPERHSLAQRSN